MISMAYLPLIPIKFTERLGVIFRFLRAGIEK